MKLTFDGLVSVERLEKFLLLDTLENGRDGGGEGKSGEELGETKPDAKDGAAITTDIELVGKPPPAGTIGGGDVGIRINNATFLWERDSHKGLEKDKELAVVVKKDGQDTAAETDGLAASSSNDDSDSKVALRNVTLEIASGELVAVIGAVGSGKSALLSAILSELHGPIKVNGCGSAVDVLVHQTSRNKHLSLTTFPVLTRALPTPPRVTLAWWAARRTWRRPPGSRT